LLFISTGHCELQQEKQEIESTLDALQEIYVGIEYCSNQSHSSREDHIGEVQKADLYISVFSEDICSSLTELEYTAAKSQNIPCLIYIKQPQKIKQHSQNQVNKVASNLRETLLKNSAFKTFENSEQLRQSFVSDLIRAFRRELFEKLEVSQYSNFSLKSLKLLCQVTIGEQIKLVGREKYIPDIYIERSIEKEVESFANFEEVFFERSSIIIDDLARIAQKYSLSDRVYQTLLNADSMIRNFQVVDEYWQFINELKHCFYYDQIEIIFSLTNLTARLPKQKEELFQSNLTKIVLDLESLPFVSKKLLRDLPKQIYSDRDLFLENVTGGNLSKEIEMTLLEILPSIIYDYTNGVPHKWKFANELIKELDDLIQLKFQKCVALVSNAGYGKTNVICHIASELSKKYPVVLLSGQIEVTSQQDIEFHVKRQLESLLPGNFSNWINRIKNISDDSDKSFLFILIDGVNESNNLPLLIRLLREFNTKIESYKVKLVLTCRNIFWDLFSATLQNSLFNNTILKLDEFTDQERRFATQLYFNRYNIQSNFDFSNTLSLRNPILLRFFCEANRDRQIEKISSIELLSVFNLYLERVEEKINERFGFLRSDNIRRFLIKIGNEMWKTRKISLTLDELGITPEEVSAQSSIFNLLRSENIIFAENLQPYSIRRNLRFLYDEFMEYVIACAWLELIEISQDSEKVTESLAQEIAAALSSFSSALGAIIFLDKMIKGDGKLVSRIVTLLAQFDDEFIASRQIIMLSAFENIATDNVTNEMMAALDKFERIARDEIREKLAPVMIQMFHQQPDHPITREMISRILEVSHSRQLTLEKKEIRENLLEINVEQKEPEKGIFSRLKELFSGTKSKERKELPEVLEDSKEPLVAKEGEILRGLPPGRYHYNEDIKLSAISILVVSKDGSELVEEGISNLGKMDLHSALAALTSLDLADDELVYKMLSKYYNAYLPEYRIYCAWLLRNRYGQEPAKYLTGLLMDRETRVHRYTMNLFQDRCVEKELLLSLLSSTSDLTQIKSWHLMNIIKILGKKERLYPQVLIQDHGKHIASALINLCNHDVASIRLESYRSLVKYDEFIDRQLTAKSMEKDTDIYIRREAENPKAID